MIRHPTLSTATAFLAACLLLAGCAGDDDSVGACVDVERIIETSSVHVLPGATVNYEASPPTSGPHQIPAPGPGVYAEALSEPGQVGALEEGLVILQYDPSLTATEVNSLEALSDGVEVIVAPGARTFDEDATVAFTAWGNRQLCDSVDTNAAAAFIERFAGVVFVNHG